MFRARRHGGLRRTTLIVAAAASAASLAAASSAQAASLQTFQVPTPGSDLDSIVQGPDGNLYFTESQDVTVNGQQTFNVGEVTTTGQLTQMQVPFQDSDTSGDDMGPTSIVSSGGKLWFLCDVGSDLYTFAPGLTSLTPLASFDDYLYGRDLTPAPGGGVWSTTGAGGDTVTLFDSSGNENDFSIPGSDPGTIVENPSNGDAVYGNGSSAIDTTSTSGANQAYPLPDLQGSSEVESMAYDNSGDLWYGTYSYDWITGALYGAIGVLRPGAASGQTIVNFTGANGIGAYPIDMTLGPDGDIWFSWSTTPDGSQTKMPGGVGRLDPSTGQVQLFDTVSANNTAPGSIAFGGDGNLYYLDRADNLVGEITDPDSLNFSSSGGGSGGSGGGGGGTGGGGSGGSGGGGSKPRSFAPRISIPHQHLRSDARRRRMTVTCGLAGSGSCSVVVGVSAATARKLGFTAPKGAKIITLTAGHGKLKHKGTLTFRMKLGAKAARRLARMKSVKLVIAAAALQPGHSIREIERTGTIRR